MRVINVDQDTEIPCVTADGVRKAIQGMSCRKAAGEDGIIADLIKDGGDFLTRKLATLYKQCLKTSNVPVSWKNANILLLHKKGHVKDLRNYRPISLLSTLNRIRATLEFNQPREQAGFRKGYSTIDHLHVINQVIEKSAEYNKPLYMAFIDYEKAFDSVEIPAVLEAVGILMELQESGRRS